MNLDNLSSYLLDNTLAVNPVGGSPACADCPVGTVAISSVEAGNHPGGSLEVKVLGGKAKAESDLSGGQTNRQVAAQANGRQAPKLLPRETDLRECREGRTSSN